MISQPTTTQVLDDCAREIRESVAPLIDDPAIKVNLEMLEQILRSCALRAGHEIAWMQEECDEIEALAHELLAQVDAPEVRTALDRYRAATTDSLHLQDRARTYSAAGEVLGCIVEAALASDSAELAEQATAAIRRRSRREDELRPDFYFPGRS